MKTHCLAIRPALLLMGLAAVGASAAPNPANSAASQPAPYDVICRTANSSTWQWANPVAAAPGQRSQGIHRYVELATGLNYQDPLTGQWIPSQERIELLPDGSAAALRGQHQAYFPPEIHDGAVELVTPGGLHLKSRPLGLSYFDGTNNVLIAELAPSAGRLTGPNQVVFANAFTGVTADLVYTYRKNGFEQDVVLREQPASPAVYGLDPANTRLELLTEFFGAPEPVQTLRPVNRRDGLADATLTFSRITFIQGKAFWMKDPAQGNIGAGQTPTYKSWLHLQGRTFLLEEVPYARVVDGLRRLPSAPAVSQLSKAAGATLNKVSIRRVLPPSRPIRAPHGEIQLAQSALRNRPGLVLDYVAIDSPQTNFTFRGDTTYFISGDFGIDGATVEAGAVIKFGQTNSPCLEVSGPFNCKTRRYQPAVLTSMNDDSVGEIISGSTGNPGIPTGSDPFILSGGADGEVHDLRFCYARAGVMLNARSGIFDVRNCQFIRCATAIENNSDAVTISLHNVLIGACSNALDWTANGGAFSAEQVTVDAANLWTGPAGGQPAQIDLTNSIVCASIAGGPILNTNCVAENPGSGIFEVSGGGHYYLPEQSPYRDAGTTNIDLATLAELALDTTRAPQPLPGPITADTLLEPVAPRDSDAPDLGYHYWPIDYAADRTCVTNAALLLNHGVVVASAGGVSSTGLVLQAGGSLRGRGTPSDPVRLTFCATVQEQASAGSTPASATSDPHVTLLAADSSALPGPQLEIQFAKFSSPAGPALFLEGGLDGEFVFSDSEFFGGGIGSTAAINGPGLLAFTDCLFDESILDFSGGGSQTNRVVLQNDLLRRGSITLSAGANDAFALHDNFFYRADVHESGSSNSISHGYNAYLNGYPRLTPPGAQDVVLDAFIFQKGPGGDFYQQSLELVNAGSTSAAQAGLWHFTTQASQVPEADSTVDIGYHYAALGPDLQPLDTDGDGIADCAEDADGNGLVDPGETDWRDYYNGKLPQLAVLEGDRQTGMPASVLPSPLTICVTAQDGHLLTNAPIAFAVVSAGARIATQASGPFTASVALRSDANGLASVFVLLPADGASSTAMTATAWSGDSSNQVLFSESVLQDIALWLKADAGVTNDSVGRWADQTTNHFDAIQISAANQPARLAGVLNHLPVIHFNGAGTYLALPDVLKSTSGTNGAEVFFVLRTATNLPSAARGLWRMGGSSLGAYAVAYPDTTGSIQDDFGSRYAAYNLGAPAESLDQFHVYEVAARDGNWTAWINGQVQANFTDTVFGEAYPYRYLGLTGVRYFAGDIAEVVVFNRVLTTRERQAAMTYLNGKYALVSATPAPPSGLVARAVSTTQISIEWSATLQDGWTRFSIERKAVDNGTYEPVAQISGATSYLDTNLSAGVAYTYRLRAANLDNWSAYSNEAQARTPDSGASLPLTNLVLWLKADTGLRQTATNSPVNFWPDQSGHGNHATQTAPANRPLWICGALNGRPAVRFNGVNSYLNLPDILRTTSGTNGAEVFFVLRAATNRPAAARGLWRMGGSTAGAYAVAYPDATGAIQDDFGSRYAAYDLGTPAQPLDQFHVFEVAARTDAWMAWINGQLQASFTGTVYGEAYPYRYLGFTGVRYFAGDIAEAMVFNRTLTASERDAVNGYLIGNYALASVPPAPAGLIATVISPRQTSLAWQYHPGNFSTAFQIERKAGPDGTYSIVARVRDAASYVDTNLAAGTDYYYRVQASNCAGESDYSNEAEARTPAEGADVPFENLRLWLKADDGIVRQGTNNAVRIWLDESGNSNHGIQTTAAAQPRWIADALNGRPAVRFSATAYQRLSLPNLLNGTTQAEALAVLKVASQNPPTSRSLWFFGAYDASSSYPGADGTLREGFGSSTVRAIGKPLQPLDHYHLYDVAGQTNQWSAWINGLIVAETNVNTYRFVTTPSLGFGNYFYFDGEIAEVLVFDRALSPAERDASFHYLNGKYAFVAPPLAPALLKADVYLTNRVLLTWSNATTTVSANSGIQIERKTEANGTYSLVATIGPVSTNFVDAILPTGHHYFYRIRAVNAVGASPDSNETEVLLNTPPAVAVTAPVAGSVCIRPDPVVLAANASDPDGMITSVEFLSDGTNRLGQAISQPYTLVWANPPAGTHTLAARATDNLGGVTVSAPLGILVNDPPLAVALISPTNDAQFPGPASISLAATASEPGQPVTRMEFYADGAKVAVSTAAPFTATWSNAPPGAYFISARAFDAAGNSANSAGVTITIDGANSDPADAIDLRVYTPLY